MFLLVTLNRHFVEAVAPTPPKPLFKKIRQLLSEAHDGDELGKEHLDKVLASLDSDGDDNDSGDAAEWSMGDCLGKLLAFITQAIDHFVLSADDSDEAPSLRNKEYGMYKLTRSEWEKLTIIHEALQRKIWPDFRGFLKSKIGRILPPAAGSEVKICPDSSKKENSPSSSSSNTLPTFPPFRLTVAKLATAFVITSRSSLRSLNIVYAEAPRLAGVLRTPTVYRVIPTLEFLIKRWETMAEQPRYSEISVALLDGVANLQKWHNQMETTSIAYFICMGAHPPESRRRIPPSKIVISAPNGTPNASRRQRLGWNKLTTPQAPAAVVEIKAPHECHGYLTRDIPAGFRASKTQTRIRGYLFPTDAYTRGYIPAGVRMCTGISASRMLDGYL
ncbi:hypothetical protein GGX14DRAFT_390693 [Mycena pura]|uniref:Uncharacterized protein n=1 Tax=Mycena pura TaxID=153505 RepID=A0AAD6VN66_9AGAR|nr:hypothetical protein GGX14DRAFT_390693 [Mycena pura]